MRTSQRSLYGLLEVAKHTEKSSRIDDDEKGGEAMMVERAICELGSDKETAQ